VNRPFKLFYDGECPICRREVAWLKRRDRAGNLELQDIAVLGFDPARYGLTREEIMRVLHGVRPDGVVIRGMEAVREAYRAVGLGWLLVPTRLPGLSALSDFFYGWFARNRRALGRLLEPNCSDEQCMVPSKRETWRR
jgi:predicted DCC family thiol-disulfide oxidoreductase YuxK